MSFSTVVASVIEKDTSQTLFQHHDSRSTNAKGTMGSMMALEAPQHVPIGAMVPAAHRALGEADSMVAAYISSHANQSTCLPPPFSMFLVNFSLSLKSMDTKEPRSHCYKNDL